MYSAPSISLGRRGIFSPKHSLKILSRILMSDSLLSVFLILSLPMAEIYLSSKRHSAVLTSFDKSPLSLPKQSLNSMPGSPEAIAE